MTRPSDRTRRDCWPACLVLVVLCGGCIVTTTGALGGGRELSCGAAEERSDDSPADCGVTTCDVGTGCFSKAMAWFSETGSEGDSLSSVNRVDSGVVAVDSPA